jgi:hypothetical protein
MQKLDLVLGSAVLAVLFTVMIGGIIYTLFNAKPSASEVRLRGTLGINTGSGIGSDHSTSEWALHRFTSATMDAISSLPPHSISLGGLRTPAPVCAAPPSWGRHPQTFTISEVGLIYSMPK